MSKNFSTESNEMGQQPKNEETKQQEAAVVELSKSLTDFRGRTETQFGGLKWLLGVIGAAVVFVLGFCWWAATSYQEVKDDLKALDTVEAELKALVRSNVENDVLVDSIKKSLDGSGTEIKPIADLKKSVDTLMEQLTSVEKSFKETQDSINTAIANAEAAAKQYNVAIENLDRKIGDQGDVQTANFLQIRNGLANTASQSKNRKRGVLRVPIDKTTATESDANQITIKGKSLQKDLQSSKKLTITNVSLEPPNEAITEIRWDAEQQSGEFQIELLSSEYDFLTKLLALGGFVEIEFSSVD